MITTPPIKQEDLAGCAVSCVAFILGTNYQSALSMFENGKSYAQLRGFFCKEIITVLRKQGLFYELKHIKAQKIEKACDSHSIIYIKKSQNYPTGHFLVSYGDKWMDPWINFPSLPIKAGFRTKLPGLLQYVITPTINILDF